LLVSIRSRPAPKPAPKPVVVATKPAPKPVVVATKPAVVAPKVAPKPAPKPVAPKPVAPKSVAPKPVAPKPVAPKPVVVATKVAPKPAVVAPKITIKLASNPTPVAKPKVASPVAMSVALSDWLKTPSGASAATFCTSLGIQTNADVYGGCLEDMRVTKSEAIAKESAVSAMEFAAKDNTPSPSTRFCVAAGDPHCTNYDGDFFHIQEPGVYTIATSRDGVFEVQEKMRKNGANNVGVPSCMTGALVRYKQLSIEVDVENYKKIRVNGAEIELKRDETVKFGGVTIRHGKQNVEWRGATDVTDGLKMTTPEGFGALIIGGYCGVLETSVPKTHYGRMGGICGNADGAKNAADYFSPSGELMDVNRGAKQWEMSGYNGPASPLSKWQLAWKPVGSRCYFAAGCEAGPNVPIQVKAVPKVAVAEPKVVAKVAVAEPKVVAKVVVAEPKVVAKVVVAEPKVVVAVPKVAVAEPKVVAKVVVAEPKVVAKVVVAEPKVVVAEPKVVVAVPKVVVAVPKVALAEPMFKFYGNYCGPNYCGGQKFKGAEGPACQWGVSPTDSLDACCRAHDQCCGLNRSINCNKEILSCLNTVKCQDTKCNLAQAAMKLTFTALQNKVCGDLIAPKPNAAQTFAASKDDVIGNVNNMNTRIVAIIHETQTLQTREIEQNKKNVNISQTDLDNLIMKQDDEQKQLQRLQASIHQVNASILVHYAQMHSDSLYLQKLDLIKPQFLQTLDATNANFAALSNHVSKLQNDEHKKFMEDILARARNATVYDTRDLAQAFLAHYEKYKHVLRTDSTDYDRDVSNLKNLHQRYASGQTVYFGLKAEVAKLRELLAALKKSMSASEADAALFAQLEQIISAILSAKKTRFAVDGAEKECAVSVLKSHVANGLV